MDRVSEEIRWLALSAACLLGLAMSYQLETITTPADGVMSGIMALMPLAAWSINDHSPRTRPTTRRRVLAVQRRLWRALATDSRALSLYRHVTPEMLAVAQGAHVNVLGLALTAAWAERAGETYRRWLIHRR